MHCFTETNAGLEPEFFCRNGSGNGFLKENFPCTSVAIRWVPGFQLVKKKCFVDGIADLKALVIREFF